MRKKSILKSLIHLIILVSILLSATGSVNAAPDYTETSVHVIHIYDGIAVSDDDIWCNDDDRILRSKFNTEMPGCVTALNDKIERNYNGKTHTVDEITIQYEVVNVIVWDQDNILPPKIETALMNELQDNNVQSAYGMKYGLPMYYYYIPTLTNMENNTRELLVVFGTFAITYPLTGPISFGPYQGYQGPNTPIDLDTENPTHMLESDKHYVMTITYSSNAPNGIGGSSSGKNYRVDFEPNGGEPELSTRIVHSGSRVSEPETLTKGKDIFDGWYTDNGTFLQKWNFEEDKVYQNVKLFAKWTAVTEPVPQKENPVDDHADDPVSETVPKSTGVVLIFVAAIAVFLYVFLWNKNNED